MPESDDLLSWPRRVVGSFLERFGRGAEPRSGRRLDRLEYALYLSTAAESIELFPAGTLDVYGFYQRRHASLHHEFEYVCARPEGAGEDELLAYAVFKLSEEEQLPFVDLNSIDAKLKRDYGSFVHLPRARELFAHQYGEDLNDGDPPNGPNRVAIPPAHTQEPGRMSVAEVLCVLRADLEPHELVSWLEAAFRQRPPQGKVEHRYYLDANARVYLVRDHWRQGKTLYRAETSPEALGPVR